MPETKGLSLEEIGRLFGEESVSVEAGIVCEEKKVEATSTAVPVL